MKKLLNFLAFFLFTLPAWSQYICRDSVSVAVCTYSGGGDAYTSKLVLGYDSLRNPVSKIYYRLENGHWKKFNGQYNQYSYDSFGHILTNQQQHSSDNSFPSNDTYQTYSYDSPNHQTQHAIYSWNGSQWVNDTLFSFYANAAGDDTLIVSETGDTSGWNNYVRTYSFYDNNHLCVHDSTQRWNGFWWLYKENFSSYSGSLADSVMTINYSSSGAIISQYYVLHQFDSSSLHMYNYWYQWDGNNWMGGLYDSTLYDAWGHLIYYSDGESYGYLYDSLGNLLEYHYHGAGQSSSDDYYYYVNGVLRSVSGSGSSQGGWSSSKSCNYRYAEIDGPLTSCGNSIVILSAQPCTPGNQYLWNTSETTQSIVGSTSNTYSLTVTYPSGFTDSSFDYTSPYSPPVQLDLGPDTILCFNQNLLLQAPVGFENYLWQDSSSLTSFLISYSMNNTVYCSVRVADSVGCIASDSIIITYDICNGISKPDDPYFSMFPNPNSGQFEISLENFSGESKQMEIFNVTGEIIFDLPITQNIQTINQTFHPGIYFVRLSDSQKQLTQKLIVE